MKDTYVQVVGWYGTIAILSAYFLNSFSILSAHTFWYQLLNLTGAGGIISVSVAKRAYQPAVLNIIWAIIALIAIIKLVV